MYITVPYYIGDLKRDYLENYPCECMHTYRHTCIHPPIHPHVDPCMHACTYTHMRTCVHTCIRTSGPRSQSFNAWAWDTPATYQVRWGFWSLGFPGPGFRVSDCDLGWRSPLPRSPETVKGLRLQGSVWVSHSEMALGPKV